MNQHTRTVIFTTAGLLLLAGAILHFTQWFYAPYLFAVGAAGIAVSYFTLPTQEMDFRQKRLHRYNIIAGLLMILSSGLMFSERKEWVLCLTIAAIMQVYAAFVSPSKDK
ncbi:hypothetical protein D0T51_07420 [Parabacteroides sp. 52]|uniref:hypothetical protein n=1 Tax=unclassified Parabacteroides TaxID=2649774 RepID=UPI0013D2758D|nr:MULTISPECIES: hypothetical protein [unclassified Parabacteroides]MDH6534838.1 fatty acid desaturase [Parabacteroides sp. PM5-20]NDV55557.1 hypothetical protein [Parabacteroides sp. 52]